MVDEQYSIVDAHIDENMRLRIENGEYIDFARLLPRNRAILANSNEMVMIMKDGRTVWQPANERDLVTINSFTRWEQAFRVFSNVFTRRHPDRSVELIQYNHIIHTAATTYSWENVYLYDVEFRMHLARNPRRSWGIILNQAWTMYLKDRIHYPVKGNNNNNFQKGNSSKREVCWRFNRGKCSYGSNCKFEHKCQVCGKFGHGAYNCRKADRIDRYRDWDRNDKDKDRDRDRRDRDHRPKRKDDRSSVKAN